MKTTEKTIAIPQRIPLSRVSDLLCAALEGGSNYWYEIVEKHEPPSLDFRSDAAHIYPHLDYPLNLGGSLVITTLERDTHKGKKQWTLNLQSIKKGLRVMSALKQGKGGHHYPNFLAENEDAETGDVFLQCCLFDRSETK